MPRVYVYSSDNHYVTMHDCSKEDVDAYVKAQEQAGYRCNVIYGGDSDE